MVFFKRGESYEMTRITGSHITQSNFLGIVFDNKNNSSDEIEIIVKHFPGIKEEKVRTSKKEVLKQVLTGLKSANQALETNYKLSKIYFSPFESPDYSVYSVITSRLIHHYHKGGEFKEI
nr:hypothetical protein [Pseudo-nitzschia hainanensis]UBA15764.1 hypothetical protein [Pseudo-nitzschia hainanensis]